MANPTLQHIILALLLLRINLLQNIHATTQKQKGFSLKMTHRDSPKSPIYRANLTEIEKLKEHVEISNARIKYLAKFYNNADDINDDYIIRPKFGVSSSDMFWFVEIGLGTFDGQNPNFLTYNLGLDTGSYLTWVQCEGCRNCFPQPAPYPVSLSKSYKKFSSQDCASVGGEPENDDCLFKHEYADDAKLIALAANETLVLESDINDQYVYLYDYNFGCGIDMENFPEGKNILPCLKIIMSKHCTLSCFIHITKLYYYVIYHQLCKIYHKIM